jgi:hypothetical protein
MSDVMRQCFANHLEVSDLWPGNSLIWGDLAAKITFRDVPFDGWVVDFRVYSRWDDVTILTSSPRFSLRSV